MVVNMDILMSFDIPWWISMISVNAINFVLGILLFIRSLKLAKKEPSNKKYFLILRVAGMIFIAVALYRSIFVSSYPNRLAWVDTIFNSPFVIRSLAFFAEMSFITVICAVLIKMNIDNPLENSGIKNKKILSFLKRTPYIAFTCLFLAQPFAFAGLITQYMTLFAIEETLWAIAFLFLTPLVSIRLIQLMKKKNLDKSYKPFLIFMILWCVGYSLFQFVYALPFIHFSDLSLDIGKVIPNDAFSQAIFNFTATRDFDAWGGIGFFVWHSGYFSICVWMVLTFMLSPRERNIRENEQLT